MLSRVRQGRQQSDQLGLDLPVVPETAAKRRSMFLRRYALAVLLILVIGVLSIANQTNGVDWGDDFALYMRQAKSLTVGNVGEVMADNRYTVDNSGWHTFSPYGYPWGWPLIVSPFYALFGLNYGLFKFLEVVAFCGFLLAFFAIVRRRTGPLAATVLMLLIGVSPRYVSATDTVISDVPYLCFVGITLWWMDRCRQRGVLDGDRRDLIILGVLLAFSWNIRREAVALVAALAALHVAVIGARVLRQRVRPLRLLREVPWHRVALPYATAGVIVVASQLVLPTSFLPTDVGESGLKNISGHLSYYRDILAENVGLKDPGVKMQLLSNPAAARRVLGLILIFAIAGLTIRLLNNLEEDVTLGAYVVVATGLMLIAPIQEGRYLYSITPFLVYFAYQALPSMVSALWEKRRVLVRAAVVVPALAIAGLAMIQLGDLLHSVRYHRAYHEVINGPETVNSQQMFEAVRQKARGDDIILFFRARAMTFYTDRVAIQGSNLDQLLPQSDWYVMEKGSTYSQTPLTDSEGAQRGLEKTWENGRFVLWRAPHKN